MNLYFVVEGETTESKAYPFWMSQMLPEFQEVDFYYQANNGNYYLFSGGGIPSIYDHILNAIRDINAHPVYSHLIVCVDGEEVGYTGRKAIIEQKVAASGLALNDNCTLEIIVQNPCIETWFLGNQRFFKHQPQGDLLRQYIQHYNVLEDDPEEMEVLPPHRLKAHFHFSYFREICKEYGKTTYKKSKPDVVLNTRFFEAMCERIDTTPHLRSYAELIGLMNSLSDHWRASK